MLRVLGDGEHGELGERGGEIGDLAMSVIDVAEAIFWWRK